MDGNSNGDSSNDSSNDSDSSTPISLWARTSAGRSRAEAPAGLETIENESSEEGNESDRDIEPSTKKKKLLKSKQGKK